jgi:hypothetical protein
MSDGGMGMIEPAGTAVTFAGREVTITPLNVGRMPAFARAVKPVGQVLEQVAAGELTLDLPGMLDIMAEHGDAVIAAVSIASRIPEAELREGELDELVGLASAALKVNADFFARRLMPALAAAMAARPAALGGPGAGPTP